MVAVDEDNGSSKILDACLQMPGVFDQMEKNPGMATDEDCRAVGRAGLIATTMRHNES